MSADSSKRKGSKQTKTVQWGTRTISVASSKRKGAKDYIVMVLGGILVAVIIIVVFIVGIEYHLGGAEVYDATAPTEEGKRFINEFRIKYVCSSVYGLEYSDIYRSGCQFATAVDRSNPEEIKYSVIKEEYVSQFNLQPDFSWWERNGRFISPIVVILLIVIIYKLQD